MLSMENVLKTSEWEGFIREQTVDKLVIPVVQSKNRFESQ